MNKIFVEIFCEERIFKCLKIYGVFYFLNCSKIDCGSSLWKILVGIGFEGFRYFHKETSTWKRDIPNFSTSQLENFLIEKYIGGWYRKPSYTWNWSVLERKDHEFWLRSWKSLKKPKNSVKNPIKTSNSLWCFYWYKN